MIRLSYKKMSIPWFYMWSEGYRVFYEIMKDTVKEDAFIMKPIEIPQSRFDSELYQVEGGHFWEGSLIKVQTLISSLESAIESNNPYILFTDIDLVVKPGVYDVLKPYMDNQYDMVFLKEGGHLNIGFILLRATPDVLKYWKEIEVLVREKGGLDQTYVNQTIERFPGKYTHFDEQIITCSNTWDCSSPYVVLQVLCSCLGKEFNMAEKIFSSAQHHDIQPYMQYVPETIYPFIYRFQELLYESHQEIKAAPNS